MTSAGALEQAGWYAQTRAGHVLAIFYEGLLWRRARLLLRDTHTTPSIKATLLQQKLAESIIWWCKYTCGPVFMRRHIMGSDPERANPCDKVRSTSRSLAHSFPFPSCDAVALLPCIMGLQMRPAFTQSHFLLHWLCQPPTTAAPARWVGGARETYI